LESWQKINAIKMGLPIWPLITAYAMIYTTNWIERLNKSFRRIMKMRNSMPGEESVLVFLGRVEMDQPAYERKLPKINYENDCSATHPSRLG
jgi:transposase-like protein